MVCGGGFRPPFFTGDAGAGTSDPGLVEALKAQREICVGAVVLTQNLRLAAAGLAMADAVPAPWLSWRQVGGVLPSSQPRYRPPGPSRSTGSPGGAEPVPGVPAAGLQLPSAPAAAPAPALPFAPQPPPFEP